MKRKFRFMRMGGPVGWRPVAMAAAVLAGAQAVAAPQWSGSVGLYAGPEFVRGSFADDPQENFDSATVGVEGALGVQLGNGLYAQLSGRREVYDNNSGNYPDGIRLLGLHVGFRGADKGYVGAFAARADAYESEKGDGSGWLAGLEGGVYFDRATFFVQGGGGEIQMHDSSVQGGFVNGMFWRMGGRLYASDGLALLVAYTGATANGYVDYDSDEGGGGNIRQLEALAEGRLPGRYPVYLYGGFRWFAVTTERHDEQNDVADGALLIGILFRPGAGGSLKDFERRGASLDLPTAPVRAAVLEHFADQ